MHEALNGRVYPEQEFLKPPGRSPAMQASDAKALASYALDFAGLEEVWISSLSQEKQGPKQDGMCSPKKSSTWAP